MPTAPVVIGTMPPDLAFENCLERYRSVGWNVYVERPDTLRAALAGSTLVVTAHRGDRLVGLARVISDGATICYLQDLLVAPDVQRQGVGRRLLDAVLAPFAHVRQKVLLTDSDDSQRAFYESVGFQETRDLGEGTLRAFLRFDR